MNISIKQLRAFMALVEQRNFTRAATQVFLSQPAFSALINSLEEAIGFRLFDRDTRSVKLTQDGQAFIHIAQRHLRLYDDSAKEVEAIARGERGKVCIAALPSVAVNWLPSVLISFRRQYPSVKVELIDALSDRCIQAVIDGIADFALTAVQTKNDALEYKKLCTESFFLACPKHHPLAQQQVVHIKQLQGTMLLLFSNTTSIRQHIEGCLPPGTLQDTLEVEQLTTMMGLIAAGLGASIIPALTLYQFAHPDIIIRPLEGLDIYREIHLVKRIDRCFSLAAQNFCTTLMAYSLTQNK